MEKVDRSNLDLALREAARSALDRAFLFAHAVTVDVDDAHVILSGQVSWRHQKSAAERAVLRVEGVTSLANWIRVHPSSSSEQLRPLLDVPATLATSRVVRGELRVR